MIEKWNEWLMNLIDPIEAPARNEAREALIGTVLGMVILLIAAKL